MKVAIYVQHLLGTGHLVRMRLLASALQAAGARVTLMSGGMPVAHGTDRDYEFVQLPPIRTAAGDFTTLLDAEGVPLTEASKSIRANLLGEAIIARQPDVVVLETWPFGRRQLRFELLPLMAQLKNGSGAPVVVSSIRDVLQRRKEKRRQETLDLIERYVDLVLVHGEKSLIPLDESFEESDQIPCPVRYSGYLGTNQIGDDLEVDHNRSPEVLLSAGGGAAGLQLLEIGIEAAMQDTRPWRIRAGASPDPEWLSSHRRNLHHAGCGERVVVEANRPDFRARLRDCDMSISQFGYNTALDLMQAGRPAVVIPYARDGETEQATRAAVFERHGLITVLPEAELSPGKLLEALARASAAPPVEPPAALKSVASGAVRAAEALIEHYRGSCI